MRYANQAPGDMRYMLCESVLCKLNGHREDIYRLYALILEANAGLCKLNGHMHSFLLPMPRFLKKTGHQNKMKVSSAQLVNITRRNSIREGHKKG